MTFIDPDRLPPPNLLSTPTSVRLELTAPHLLDGPNGPIGLFTPAFPAVEDRCPYGVDPLCWGPTPISGAGPLGTVAFASDGTITASLTAPNSEGEVYATVQGCTGAGYDGSAPPARFIVFDRCTLPGQLQAVAELPAESLDRTHAVTVRANAQTAGIASFIALGVAVLFDFRQPLAPVVMNEQLLPPARFGGFYGTAFDGKYWALTWENEMGPLFLMTIDVEAGGQELHRMAFDPALGRFSGHVLTLQWPLLYVGMEQDGEAFLRVFDLAQTPPQLIHTLPLDSPAIDLVAWRDQLYLARADGLSIIEPACTDTGP